MEKVSGPESIVCESYPILTASRIIFIKYRRTFLARTITYQLQKLRNLKSCYISILQIQWNWFRWILTPFVKYPFFWNQLNRYDIRFITSYPFNQIYRSNSQSWLSLIFWTQWNWSGVLNQLFAQIDYFCLSIILILNIQTIIIEYLNWS